MHHKKKNILQKNNPIEKNIFSKSPSQKTIPSNCNPEEYYKKNPSWCFNSCDDKRWCFGKESLYDSLWDELLPRMKELEKQTWNDIFLIAKNENHTINFDRLNKNAKKRLEDMYIEYDSVASIRITSTHRLYGYMQGSTFCILWYDPNHGDNDTCVCRSHKKHT